MSLDSAWALFTRLGEAQILLPAMAAALLWLARSAHTRPLAGAWLGATLVATAVTTLSKIAFIGWGLGYAPLDFTGVSGHTMFAAVVLPVLARVAAGDAAAPVGRRAAAAGFVLAAAIGWSRIETGTHSVSEVVLGFAVGGAAALWALRGSTVGAVPSPRWGAAVVAVWLLALPWVAPTARTHDWVTHAALKLSGHPLPYTRHHLHREARLRQSLQRRQGAAAPARQLQVQPADQRQLGSDRLR